MNMKVICNAMCRDKGNGIKTRKLETILSRLKSYGIKPETGKRIPFTWDIYEKCRYGITCPDLKQTESRNIILTREIDKYLIPLAESKDIRKMQEILQLLRGDFPSAYNYVNQMIRR